MSPTQALVLLDMNLAATLWHVQVGGSLTFRNVAITNMLPRSAFYPDGLLTSLLWFVSLEG